MDRPSDRTPRLLLLVAGIKGAIGTTLAVYPIAAVVSIAAENGARVIIVNAEPTEMDSLADVLVRGSISEVLPRMLRSDEDTDPREA